MRLIKDSTSPTQPVVPVHLDLRRLLSSCLASVLTGVLALSPLLTLAQVDVIEPTTAATATLPAPRWYDTLGVAQAQRLARPITADRLRRYAFALASDSLQGRETGTEGQRRAARYISGELAKMGYPRIGTNYSYEQPIAFERTSWDHVRLVIGQEEMRHLRDFYVFANEAQPLNTVYDEVVVLGYGIDAPGYSDYAAAGDLRGKAVVVLAGEPFGKTGLSLVTGTADTSDWSRDIALKRAAAQRNGAAVLLVVEPAIQSEIARLRSRLTEAGLRIASTDRIGDDGPTINTIHISPKIYADLVAAERRRVIRARKRAQRKGQPQPVSVRTLADARSGAASLPALGQQCIGLHAGQ